MTNRNKIRIGSGLLFLLFSLLTFSGYMLTFPEYFELSGFFNHHELSVGEPLYRGMKYITPVFLLLVFVPQTYHSWKKFGLWALPLFVILVAVTPVTGETFSPVPSRDIAALRLSQLFLIISAFIIVYSWWKNRG